MHNCVRAIHRQQSTNGNVNVFFLFLLLSVRFHQQPRFPGCLRSNCNFIFPASAFMKWVFGDVFYLSSSSFHPPPELFCFIFFFSTISMHSARHTEPSQTQTGKSSWQSYSQFPSLRRYFTTSTSAAFVLILPKFFSSSSCRRRRS